MKHLKKISSEILHENPWWVYKHDTYEKPNGTVGDYFYAETPGMVVIVPVLPDGRLVLTTQFRYLRQKLSIEFPAGGIKKGMSPEETARQELLEETGCTTDQLIYLGEIEPSNGFVNDQSHIFFAEVKEVGTQALDETEEIEVLYRRPDEVEDMIHHNEIWDGQTIVAWTMARRHIHPV